MSKTQSRETEIAVFPISSQNKVADWFIRLGKGIGVGIGFILPGLSGGVLAVIFGIYDIMLRFLANLRRQFWQHVNFFIPVGIGGVLGILFFSKVVSVALDKYAIQAVSLFIGFVVGTFPSLFHKAGLRGRKRSEVTLMVVLAFVFATFMIWVGDRELARLPGNFATWLLSGALIGLGVIVPGMSPSNFLLYFGLYDKMTQGIAALDFAVIIPLFIGLAACILLLAKGVSYLFEHYYGTMYHMILGLVVGSSTAIVFTEILPGLGADALANAGLSLPWAVALCVLFFIMGAVLSWAFSRVEAKYDPDEVKARQTVENKH